MSKLIMEDIAILTALTEQERELVIIDTLGEGLGNEAVKALKQSFSGDAYSENLNKLIKELQCWGSEEGCIERAQELWRGCKLSVSEVLGTVKRELTAKKRVEALGLYTISELTEEQKAPPEFIIDGMLPVGLTFIVGASKIGKSFLALQLCEAVTEGTEFLGKKAHNVEAIYFDLESSPSLIEDRRKTTGFKLGFQIGHEAPGTIAGEDANSLAEGLRALKYIHKELKLVVIDTYGFVRGTPKRTGKNAYDADIELLKPMHQLAHELGIALVFIHHESKGTGKAKDEYERASGSTAITGTADCNIFLSLKNDRTSDEAILSVSGRVIQPFKYQLKKDARCIWHTQGTVNELALKSSAFKWIIDNLPAPSENKFYTYAEIAEGSGLVTDGREGDAVKRELEPAPVQDELYNRYGAIIQLGQRSTKNGVNGYGIRICRK